MRLSVPQGDGAPLRTHLQRAARAGHRDPMLLESDQPLPPTVVALWAALLALRSSVKGPVSHSEIRAWEACNGVRLSPWEVETLLCADRAARDVEAEPTRKDLSA